MPLSALVIPILLAAAAAEEPPITVQGYPWAPFISPMGEPFRARSTGEAPIARWFAQADWNQDGMLTSDEMQADADRFFARLDSSHDGIIDREEVVAYESEFAPEIQVNSDWRRTRGEAAPQVGEASPNRPRSGGRRRADDQHDGYRVEGLQGAARYGLLNIPQPVAGADADFNRAIALQEFRQAATYRFKLLDGNRQGYVTLPELEARLPVRPKGKRAKPRKNETDTRIGLSLPEGS